MNNDNRLVLVRVPQNTVLEWFKTALHGPARYVIIPVIKGLPDDCRVHSVHFDFMSQSFVFTVQHESFDPVEPGCCIPVFINDLMEHRAVKIDKESAVMTSINDSPFSPSHVVKNERPELRPDIILKNID